LGWEISRQPQHYIFLVTLQSRLQTIEQDLWNIKEKALLVNSENLNNLVEVIEKVTAERKKDLNETKDALSETEVCVEEMGRDFVKNQSSRATYMSRLKQRWKR